MEVSNIYGLIAVLIVQIFTLFKVRNKKQIKAIAHELGLLAHEFKLLVPVIKEVIFERDFTKRLTDKAAEHISSSDGLKRDIKTLLLIGFRKFLSFGIHNFISPNDLKDKYYYEDITNSIIDELQTFSIQLFPEYRIYNKEPLKFHEYIQKKESLKLLKATLIDRLLKNKLDSEAYIRLFEDYIKDFYRKTIKHWRDFNDLPLSK
jgi:hypothetical protein